MENQKSRYARQRRGMLLALIFVGIILVIAYVQQTWAGSRYEKTVKNASPTAWQNETYEEAFDSFFTDGKWQTFQQQDESYIVQFSGVCTYEGASDYTLIQFMVGEIPSSSTSAASGAEPAESVSSASEAGSAEAVSSVSEAESTGSDSASSESADSASGTQIRVSPVTSTDDVHIIYIGLNEEELTPDEQEAFLKAVFSN